MSGFVEGIDRSQSTLFPAVLDDYVAEDNPVRAVDAFVEGLDLGGLGFGRVTSLEQGRPSYHPATLLKIYIYGYLNRVPSSRRLERECQRNIELVWLTGQLAPDFKTIADFRKDNGKAIREVCRSFVALCRELHLLSEASVAIDGSKFKAVNARDKNFTDAKMKRRLERMDESIGRYMAQLETADRRGDVVPEAKVARLRDKIVRLKEEVARLGMIKVEMMMSENKKISLTDPDARSMTTSGKDTGIVGYNVQAAVDTKNHLIVAHEVTNVGTDHHQLSNMAEQARTEMGVETLDAVADRGYYASEESGTAWSRFIFIREAGTIHARLSRSNSRHFAPNASLRRTPVRITNFSARSSTLPPSVAINPGTSIAVMAALGFTSAIFLESSSRTASAQVAGFGSTCFAVRMNSMSRRNRLPRLLPGPFHIGRNVLATCSVVIRFTGTSASTPACASAPAPTVRPDGAHPIRRHGSTGKASAATANLSPRGV